MLIFIYHFITGGTLLKVGLCQQKLGSLERDFSFSAGQGFGEPLKKFLETDLKVISCLLYLELFHYPPQIVENNKNGFSYERLFSENAVILFWQSILRERKLLEAKRLDLDACKNRLKKAKTVVARQTVSNSYRASSGNNKDSLYISKMFFEKMYGILRIICNEWWSTWCSYFGLKEISFTII